jgi:aldehyde:ferredoxin oxidoreductase
MNDKLPDCREDRLGAVMGSKKLKAIVVSGARGLSLQTPNF